MIDISLNDREFNAATMCVRVSDSFKKDINDTISALMLKLEVAKHWHNLEGTETYVIKSLSENEVRVFASCVNREKTSALNGLTSPETLSDIMSLSKITENLCRIPS